MAVSDPFGGLLCGWDWVYSELVTFRVELPRFSGREIGWELSGGIGMVFACIQ
jgi:hypothetical protein